MQRSVPARYWTCFVSSHHLILLVTWYIFLSQYKLKLKVECLSLASLIFPTKANFLSSHDVNSGKVILPTRVVFVQFSESELNSRQFVCIISARRIRICLRVIFHVKKSIFNQIKKAFCTHTFELSFKVNLITIKEVKTSCLVWCGISSWFWHAGCTELSDHQFRKTSWKRSFIFYSRSYRLEATVRKNNRSAWYLYRNFIFGKKGEVKIYVSRQTPSKPREINP